MTTLYKMPDRPMVATLGSLLLNQWAPEGYFLKVLRMPGWKGTPGVRKDATPRLWAHGDFSERGWRTSRLITIEGRANLPTEAALLAAHEAFSSALADGTEGVLVVDDPIFGVLHASVTLATGSDLPGWEVPGIYPFQIQLVAADPRKYGQTLTGSTGVPVDGGGLGYDLYTAKLGAALRNNLVIDPKMLTDWTTRWSGGGTATATHTPMVGATPVGDRFLRKAWIAGAVVTNGDTGVNNSTTLPVVAGRVYSFSGFLRPSASGKTGRAWIQFYDADYAMVEEMTYGATVPLPAGAWSALAVTVTAPARAVGAIVCLDINAAGPLWATGDTLDGCGALLEQSGTVGTYFDGDSPATADKVYAWSGTANSSASVEYQQLGNPGVLDYGAAGSPGIVSLTNPGTADTPVVHTITGACPLGFSITEIGTGRRLVYAGAVITGQVIRLDSADGSVTLDDDGDRGPQLVRREWVRLGKHETGTWLFEAPGSTNALLRTEVTPAWW